MASRVFVSLRVKATPERAFDVFTREIGLWWRPNGLFHFTPRGAGTLSFEPGADGRLIETQPDGTVFEVGRVLAWEPPSRLLLSWRQASFRDDQLTQVEVRFVAAGDETRVVVEHTGWDTVPTQSVARHGFPDAIFLQRHAEWWQSLLRSLALSTARD